MVTSISADTIGLIWNDNSFREDFFEIERSENGGFYSVVGSTGRGATRFTDVELPEETMFSYRVRAVRDGVNSGHTNVVTATTAW